MMNVLSARRAGSGPALWAAALPVASRQAGTLTALLVSGAHLLGEEPASSTVNNLCESQYQREGHVRRPAAVPVRLPCDRSHFQNLTGAAVLQDCKRTYKNM